jgi:hypothetical protein
MIILAAASSPHRDRLHIPNRSQVKERLIILSQKTHAQLLSQLPHNTKISLAVDCWTSPDRKAFLVIIGYFLTKKIEYQEVLLGFQPVSGAYENKSLAKNILLVLHKHNLAHRILGVTTDNASNNGTMFLSLTTNLKTQLAESSQLQDALTSHEFLNIINTQHHIPCLAHVIQLAATALLRKLCLETLNEEIEYSWENGEENLAAHHDIARTIEKVSCFLIFVHEHKTVPGKTLVHGHKERSVKGFTECL